MITEEPINTNLLSHNQDCATSPKNNTKDKPSKLEMRKVTQQQALNELIIGASVVSSGSFRSENRQNDLNFPNFQRFARSISGESLPETGEPRELTQEVAVVQEKLTYKGVAFRTTQHLVKDVNLTQKDNSLMTGQQFDEDELYSEI